MAKLEEKITPSDLLIAMREGRLKDELIKEFRTSDEELAMMLLPLYRNGELKKDEFNNFFKGQSLAEEEQKLEAEEAETPEEKPEVDHDAPTEFLGAFSRVFSRKPAAAQAPEVPLEEPESHEERQTAPTHPVFEAMEEAEEEEPPAEPAEEADLDLELKDTADVEEASIAQEAGAKAELEAELEAETVEEPKAELDLEPELEADFSQPEDVEEIEAFPVDIESPAEAAIVGEETATAEPSDESKILSALEDIRSRLASIESRLKSLESKL